VRQQVRRRLALMGVTDNNQREVIFVDVNNAPSLSDFMKKSIFTWGVIGPQAMVWAEAAGHHDQPKR
jgi:hypothetical protein